MYLNVRLLQIICRTEKIISRICSSKPNSRIIFLYQQMRCSGLF